MRFAKPPNDFSSNLQELRAGTENVGLAVGLVSNQNFEGTERFKVGACREQHAGCCAKTSRNR